MYGLNNNTGLPLGSIYNNQASNKSSRKINSAESKYAKNAIKGLNIIQDLQNEFANGKTGGERALAIANSISKIFALAGK